MLRPAQPKAESAMILVARSMSASSRNSRFCPLFPGQITQLAEMLIDFTLWPARRRSHVLKCLAILLRLLRKALERSHRHLRRPPCRQALHEPIEFLGRSRLDDQDTAPGPGCNPSSHDLPLCLQFRTGLEPRNDGL